MRELTSPGTLLPDWEPAKAEAPGETKAIFGRNGSKQTQVKGSTLSSRSFGFWGILLLIYGWMVPRFCMYLTLNALSQRERATGKSTIGEYLPQKRRLPQREFIVF
jgi:hypothetical protein